MTINIKEIKSKTILQKSGLPDVDWVINAYTGCRFGCKYCYAAFVGKFTHPGEEWGGYVDAKLNAPELLRKELSAKLKDKNIKDIGTIFLSSVTDPYQGLESKYQLTRGCLQVLIDHKYVGKVSILTKSALVTRDIDLFLQIPNIEVGMTVTSTGDPISKYLETFATPNEDRIVALKTLHKAGIRTYAFVGPLLPHFVYDESALDNLFKSLKESGVVYCYIEHLNLTPYIRDRLFEYLEKDYPNLLDSFRESMKPENRVKLDTVINKLLEKYLLSLAHNEIIYHKDKESWKKLKK